jgi:hypothetical protein
VSSIETFFLFINNLVDCFLDRIQNERTVKSRAENPNARAERRYQKVGFLKCHETRSLTGMSKAKA